MDPKSEKCILVGYSHEQKGYTCYNPRKKQVRVSPDVIFEESTSWYSLSSLSPEDSVSIAEYQTSEAKMILEKEEIDTQEVSLISFRLSGPNEE